MKYTFAIIAACTIEMSLAFKTTEPFAALTPDLDFNTCAYQTVMCCWILEGVTKNVNGKKTLVDTINIKNINTQVCTKPTEYGAHCHGMAWSDKNDIDYKNSKALLNYINDVDHFTKRNYFGVAHFDNNVRAPKCGCIENMPAVERSDCSTSVLKADGSFKNGKACRGNDLKNQTQDKKITKELYKYSLVGKKNCNKAVGFPAIAPASASTVKEKSAATSSTAASLNVVAPATGTNTGSVPDTKAMTDSHNTKAEVAPAASAKDLFNTGSMPASKASATNKCY